jgi:pimeloyl-ACP methyl ester carboxylesterase
MSEDNERTAVVTGAESGQGPDIAPDLAAIEIEHRVVEVNGLRMRLAEAGSGPLVVLLHGFPESWYSWRHQLRALADAGFHAVAPNQRGYPGTGSPAAVADYTMMHLVGDVVGLIGALGEQNAAVIGHDWGAPVAWHTALLRPDLVRGVGGLSVPFSARTPVPALTATRARFGDTFYQLYLQRPGVEEDFESDLVESYRRILFGLSGDNPEVRRLLITEGQRFFDGWISPDELPAWLTERDVAAYVEEFAESGFLGPLNWYRNIDRNWALTAPWEGAQITPPALFLAGDRDPVMSWYDTSTLEASLRTVVPNLRRFQLEPGAGHWIQQERPEVTNAALVEFATATSRSTRDRGVMEPQPPQPPFCVHDTGSTQYWIWPYLIGDWRYRVINKEKRGTRYAYDVHIWNPDRGWVFVVQVDASSPDEGGFVAALEVANTITFGRPGKEDMPGPVGSV